MTSAQLSEWIAYYALEHQESGDVNQQSSETQISVLKGLRGSGKDKPAPEGLS